MRKGLQVGLPEILGWATLFSRFYSWGPGSASAGSNGMLTCHAQPNPMSAIGT